jgi:hypothetical protein
VAETLEIGIACRWGLAQSEPATAEDSQIHSPNDEQQMG